MIRLVIFDWGDTVMRELPDFKGKMVDAPHVEAMPGIREVLETLHPDYRLILASNAQDSAPPDIRAALRRVELDSYFERIYASSTLGIAKPSPAFFDTVVRDCGVVPGESVNIGDTFDKDIVGAKQAGLRAVWYNWKNAALPPGIEIRPDGTIRDHAETAAAIRALDGA